MSDTDLAFHYVCTPDEARELIRNTDRFWISDCGCREKTQNCKSSGLHVCLWFRFDSEFVGSNVGEVDREEAAALVPMAEKKKLVTRPFRDDKDRTRTDGICFCCDCCCEYFTKPDEKCDPGRYIEVTDATRCSDCGNCVDVCYFGARKLTDETFVLTHENCYGCALCLDLCPEEAISLTETSHS